MLIFIDIETTGVEVNDTICSIAILNFETYKYELVNEGKKIHPQASSINHITNEMLKSKVAFKDSEIYRYLSEHNIKENTLISHNVQTDLEKLSLAGFIWQGSVINTQKVTKHLIPECELFSLQVLRYELRLYKNEKTQLQKYGIKYALFAHHALSDVLVVKLLFEYLKDLADEDMMRELSLKNVLLEKFAFGKYKGRYIEDVCINDKSYVEWLICATNTTDEDTKYSISYYLQG